MPTATATSGAGRRLVRRGSRIRMASVTQRPAQRWASEIWSRLPRIWQHRLEDGPFSTGMPRTLPNCPTKMTSPMPALKPVSTGSEIKLARKPRRSRPGQQQKDAHQQGQRRGGDQVVGRVAALRDARQLGGGEHRDGRGAAHAQRPRGAQQDVDQHRHQGRVEADLHRQAGDGGVGHGLGDDHGRGRQRRPPGRSAARRAGTWAASPAMGTYLARPVGASVRSVTSLRFSRTGGPSGPPVLYGNVRDRTASPGWQSLRQCRLPSVASCIFSITDRG